MGNELQKYARSATNATGAVMFMWKFPNHPWSPKFLKYYSALPVHVLPAPAGGGAPPVVPPGMITQSDKDCILARARDLVLWHPSLRSESWFQDLVKFNRQECRPPSERE